MKSNVRPWVKIQSAGWVKIQSARTVYVLKVTNVPDSSQRYTLALDPALFTDGKFDLSFGDDGNISMAEAELTSQVVATIKAVGSYATNRFKATSAADEITLLAQLRSFTTDEKNSACTKKYTSPVTQRHTTVAEAIAADWDKINDATPIGDDSSKNVLNQYYYKSSAERDCLSGVWLTVKAKTYSREKIASDAYEKAQEPFKSEHDPVILSIVSTINKWVDSNDRAAFKKMDKAPLTTIPKMIQTADLLTNLMDSAEHFVTTKLEQAELREYARALADMSPATAGARQATAFQKRIDSLRIDLVGMTDPTTVSSIESQIQRFERDLADAIGARKIWNRIEAIDRFLQEVRITRAPDGTQRYAADEHVKLSAERDRLKAQFDDIRISYATSEKVTKVKVTAEQNIAVHIVDESYVSTVNSKWGALFGPWEYVVVLKPIPAPTHTNPQSLSGENK